MRPNEIWFDVQGDEWRVWVDSHLNLARASGGASRRVGFFREIALCYLPASSAHPLGWTSFPWEGLQKKFSLEADFWPALEAARFHLVGKDAFGPPFSLIFPQPRELLFFAGSFNPWHDGHQACLDLAPSDFPILICPDRNPDKATAPMLDLENLKKAVRIPRGKRILFYPGFSLNQGPHPTINWVEAIKSHDPATRIHLLMGHDAFAGLNKWRRATELLPLLSGLWVASRLETDADHAMPLTAIHALSPGLPVHFLGHHEYEACSSRALRDC